MSEAVKSATRTWSFVVEVAGPNNDSVIWPLDQRRLRGRWARANVREAVADERFAHMPDLPGLCLQIDSGKRVGRIYDPLAKPANERLLRKAQATCKAQFGKDYGPEEEFTCRLDDDGVKGWLYWLKRLVDARLARVVQGSLPTMDEIEALPGKISFRNFDLGGNVERLRDKAERPYQPVRHDEEADAPITML